MRNLSSALDVALIDKAAIEKFRALGMWKCSAAEKREIDEAFRCCFDRRGETGCRLISSSVHNNCVLGYRCTKLFVVLAHEPVEC
jgi:hypothetical protein